MPTPPSKTVEQLSAALERLSAADLLRLRSTARFLSVGLGENQRSESWEDLLQEAIVRSLSGDRKWPEGIDLRTFLIGTMRSIASSWAKRPPEKPVSEPEAVSQEALALDRITAHAFLDDIEKQLGPDETAIQILQCMVLGMKGSEIVTKLGLDLPQYQSAVKRIRRKALKIARAPI